MKTDRPSMSKRWTQLGCLTVMLLVLLGFSACSSSGKSTLDLVVFLPFSGHDASFGPPQYAGCVPAVLGINEAGGVLGHKFKCLISDTRGDPADAVSAATKNIGTDSNLVGVLGPGSDEDLATIPVFTGAKIPTFEEGGTAFFNTYRNPYYWRTSPADNLAGFAMALAAKQRGYTSIALVLGNDSSAQGNSPGILAGARVLGINVVANLTLTQDQTSYNTEVQRIVSSHPQAILTETDSQTAGVFFGELKGVGGLTNVVGSPGIVIPDYNTALLQAIGQSDYTRYFSAVNFDAATSGPAYDKFNSLLLASGGLVKNPGQYSTYPYTAQPYDNANEIALAMLAAKSVDPSVFDFQILNVTTARPGAVVVSTFAEGKAALASGKHIQYVGPTGPAVFDAFHNSPGEFGILSPAQNYKVLGIISAPDLSSVVARSKG